MEEWRPIKDYEGLYEVSNMGRVKNLNYKGSGKEKILKNIKRRKGYLMVILTKNGKRRGFLVHRLVAEAFIPNPNNLPEVNHIDRDRANNHVDNLEWVTHSDNMKHSYKLGINCEPLRKYSQENRKKVTNGKNVFGSISEAADWLFKKGYSKNKKSAIAGISAVVREKRKTFGGYSWKYI